PWEYLPHDFPPYKTVYDYYAKWEADGTTQQVHDLLRDKTRRFHGRRAEPTAAVVDAQSVKTSANVAEPSQGIDAGKKIKGRKRHLITDTLGLVPAVLVTAANVHDTTGGKLLLDDLAAAHPSVSKVWADGGYQNSIFNAVPSGSQEEGKVHHQGDVCDAAEHDEQGGLDDVDVTPRRRYPGKALLQ
ncbi:transposase, partial [Streptomyces sp. NPDC088921]